MKNIYLTESARISNAYSSISNRYSNRGRRFISESKKRKPKLKDVEISIDDDDDAEEYDIPVKNASKDVFKYGDKKLKKVTKPFNLKHNISKLDKLIEIGDEHFPSNGTNKHISKKSKDKTGDVVMLLSGVADFIRGLYNTLDDDDKNIADGILDDISGETGQSETITENYPIDEGIGKSFAGLFKSSAKGATKGVAKGATKGVAKGATKGVAKGATKGVAKGATKGMTKGVTKGVAKGVTKGIGVLKNYSTKLLSALRGVWTGMMKLLYGSSPINIKMIMKVVKKAEKGALTASDMPAVKNAMKALKTEFRRAIKNGDTAMLANLKNIQKSQFYKNLSGVYAGTLKNNKHVWKNMKDGKMFLTKAAMNGTGSNFDAVSMKALKELGELAERGWRVKIFKFLGKHPFLLAGGGGLAAWLLTKKDTPADDVIKELETKVEEFGSENAKVTQNDTQKKQLQPINVDAKKSENSTSQPSNHIAAQQPQQPQQPNITSNGTVGMSNNFGNAIANGIGGIGQGIGGAVSGIGQGIGGAVSGIGQGIGGAVSGIGQGIGGIGQGIGNAIGGLGKIFGGK